MPCPPGFLRPIGRRLLAALGLVLAGGCLAASDVDLKVPARDSRLSGRLQAMGLVLAGEGERLRSIGSGFLASPCHVLTAAHVLTREGQRPQLGMTARFVPAQGNYVVGIAERALPGTVVAAGEDFIAKSTNPGRPDLRNVTGDWALIELDRPVTDIPPFKLLHPDAPQAESVSAVGFPLNRRTMLIHAHEGCAIRSGYHDARQLLGLLVVDCAVREGMSGGPLLIDAGGQLIAAGIIVERVEIGAKAERIASLAVPISRIAERIGSVLRASRVCAVGQPFVLPAAPAP